MPKLKAAVVQTVIGVGQKEDSLYLVCEIAPRGAHMNESIERVAPNAPIVEYPENQH